MTKYITATETAKLVRKALKANFPKIKFSVRKRGASLDVQWVDGPSRPSVEKVAKGFEGATFDGMFDLKSYVTSEYEGEEVSFGVDYVICQRTMTRAYVEAIVAAFCKAWGHKTSEIEITGTEENAYAHAWSLGISEDHFFQELLYNTDAKDMHRPYEAEEERKQRQAKEWARNEPQRKAKWAKEKAEAARQEEARRRQEAKREQERKEREQRENRRFTLFSTREEALKYLGLSSTASDTMVKTIFKIRVRKAADGKGGYTEDMDKLVKAKEKALQR